MDITTTSTPYGARIGICSRLDVLSSKDLQDAIEEAVAKGAANLVCDFTAVEYVSSSGLRVLLSARKLTKARGGTVVLCGINPFVQGVLATTGFDQLFTSFRTLEEAEKSLTA